VIRAVLILLIALTLAGPLAACGKKGDPTLPAGVSDDYPRKYPTKD
jgi:predicted small lipoprotein YifL